MPALGFSLFDTALGRCGVSWTAVGIRRLQLPDADEARMRARLGGPEAGPSPEARAAIEGVAALLAGEAVDLSVVVLDMSGRSPFEARVYAALREVPRGETVTYGELARRVGEPGAAQAVGRAMGRNPFAPVVPCHRVLGADGRAGGFSARGGVSTKMRLLELERAGRSGDGLFPDLPLAIRP